MPAASTTNPELHGSAFLKTARGEPAAHTPVWFMRQAGRSLPEYRSLRGSGSILDAIRDPELSAEITLQPVQRYGVDAAILYSDIVVPVAAIGFGVDVAPGIGPVVAEPFAAAADLARLRPLDPENDTPYVLETVKILTRELRVPLIGFAGALDFADWWSSLSWVAMVVSWCLIVAVLVIVTRALRAGERPVNRPPNRPTSRPGPWG